ncbi:TIGR04222 domain-containing membrane protein [Gemmata sp.]|uniref:TIGR04222 domain-containing membrane protein n=1 Tax=Gemmata sp. TaxID=1914242 RepID=UPI003F726231
MRSDHSELLSRVESFDIDGGRVGLPFAARLARENGWSRARADRVIAEYKRFVFLSVTSDAPVCPSEDVDAAWHLHLTYTRSYWQRFCGDALGRPLHHEPTKGGPAEHEKHLAMYARTLQRYREAFGCDAPSDVWSGPEARFGDDLNHRSVNTSKNWVVAKAPVRGAAKLAALFAAVAVLVPGCEGGPNPFALVGAKFLGFLIPMMIGAVALGRVIISNHRGPEPVADEVPDLDWEQVAFLAGGPARLTTAAASRLVADGSAAVRGERLVPLGAPRDGATEVERAVFAGLPVEKTTAALAPVAKAVHAAYDAPARQLEADGYLLSRGAKARAWLLGVTPLLAVMLGLALPRFAMGLTHGKSVEYLIATSMIGLIVGLAVVSAGVPRLTRRGEHALAALKERNQTLQTGSAWNGSHDAALAVALFGTAALAGSSIAFMQDWYPRQTAAASGGCGTSGCGTGGCGDGGGGCGGGGCGGCGGD